MKTNNVEVRVFIVLAKVFGIISKLVGLWHVAID